MVKKHRTHFYSWQKCIMQPGLICVVCICKDFLDKDRITSAMHQWGISQLYRTMFLTAIFTSSYSLFHSSSACQCPKEGESSSCCYFQGAQPCLSPALCTSTMGILCLAIPKDGFIIPFYDSIIIERLWIALGKRYTQLGAVRPALQLIGA